MTAPLTALLERVEAATEGSRELDAQIICALAAPSGAWTERSKYNGAWVIYDSRSRSGIAREWEYRGGWHRSGGWPVTASVDAALALVERVLPTRWWVLNSGIQSGTPCCLISLGKGPDTVRGHGSTMPLAILAALLKGLHALASRDAAGPADAEGV